MGKYIELNQTNMEETIKEGVVLVDFGHLGVDLVECLLLQLIN